jgi:hypothetical protein
MRAIIEYPLIQQQGPLSINVKKAMKTRVFMAFLTFILRGPSYDQPLL